MQTGQGAAHVLQARAVMMNPVRRSQAVRDALLAWLYGHRTHLQGAIHVDKFLSDPHSAYAGQFFSLHDIDDAASYLRDKELIKGTGIEQRRGPVIAAITASGIDCIEQGGSVADYIRPPARAAVNYSFNAPISGPNIAIGDNATQYYANYGLNAGEICELMQTIVEALPGLSLELSQQDAAEAITSQVIIETKTDTPDTTKITQALKKLRGVLATSVKSALSTALTALIDSALTKAGIPPSTGA